MKNIINSLSHAIKLHYKNNHRFTEYFLLSHHDIVDVLSGVELIDWMRRYGKGPDDLRYIGDQIIQLVEEVNMHDEHHTNFVDFKYFKDICSNIINTLTLELEHIDNFDKQYIRCYTTDVSSTRQAIIDMAGGLDKIQLDTKALTEYKKVHINLYDSTECYDAGLEPIHPVIADKLSRYYPLLKYLFYTKLLDYYTEQDNSILAAATTIKQLKTLIIKQCSLYEQLAKIANKMA